MAMRKITEEEKGLLKSAWISSWLWTYGFDPNLDEEVARKAVPEDLHHILDDNDLMDKYVTDIDILTENCHDIALAMNPTQYNKAFSNDY